MKLEGKKERNLLPLNTLLQNVGCISCGNLELETKFQSKNIGPCQLFQNSSVIHLWIFLIRAWGCCFICQPWK